MHKWGAYSQLEVQNSIKSLFRGGGNYVYF